MVILSCSWALYVDRIFLTLRMNVFHSVYLSVASQLNCGCFSAGPPSLGPCWPSDLWVCVSANVWIPPSLPLPWPLQSPHSLTLGLSFFFLLDLIIYQITLLGVCFFSLPLLRPIFHSRHHVIVVMPWMTTNALVVFYYIFIASAIKCVHITSVCIYIMCEHHLTLGSDWTMLAITKDALVI